MTEHTIVYKRVMTVESETELSQAELLEIAREDLHDDSGLWTVEIDDGKALCLPMIRVRTL